MIEQEPAMTDVDENGDYIATQNPHIPYKIVEVSMSLTEGGLLGEAVVTDVDAIVAGLSEAERAALLNGLILPCWLSLLQKGLIGADGYTEIGLAVRAKLENQNV